jgi:predicted aldo/keto reductase-like oxidoreductase
VAIAQAAHSEPLIRNDETMRYRPFGKTGYEVSALSFGCMRLQDDPELNEKLISRAVDLGVNYFETTRYYLGGTCQHRTAPGLKGKAAGVIVSGKERIHADQTAYLFRKEVERQLDILGIDHFKFFQVGWFSWGKMQHLLKRGGVLDAVRKAQDEGLIKFLGFTGHDKPENFIRCIETGLFDSFTVPYNLISRQYEPLIARAGELGVGVVAMCPVGGGVLACSSKALAEAVGMDLPTPAMSLRFVLSNPHISTACSGMNTLEMLEENVETVGSFGPDEADWEEMCAGLDHLREKLGERFCTSCRYCAECPAGLEIWRLMNIWQHWKVWGLEDWAADALRKLPDEKKPTNCTQCGACEEKCPNKLEVQARLEQLGALL